MSFRDHFSQRSAAYARYRPTYPRELFVFLAEVSRNHRVAWDCATGSGQAAIGLAGRFDRVIGTDASWRQLINARKHPRARYVHSTAEASGLRSSSVDLVVAAQAVHWFDFERFWAEVRRVGAVGATVAVWTYTRARVDCAVDAEIDQFYDRIAPWWPAERCHVEDGYESVPFPFQELPAPAFEATAELELEGLIGYLGTWSAVARYRRAEGHDPLDEIGPRFVEAWGGGRHVVRWPIRLRVGTVI